MYGYGLEGYGLYGQGYRYPPIEGYYDQPIEIGTIQKGPREGQKLQRYLPKVDDRWVAAYLLNKQLAAKNEWRKYATKALQEASKQYLADLKAKDPNAYAAAIKNKERRETRKGQLPLALRSAEAQKWLHDLQGLSEADLIQHYYRGRKIRKKTRSKLAQLQELAKKIESPGQEVLPTRPVQKTGIHQKMLTRIKTKIPLSIITKKENIKPVQWTEEDYKEGIERLKRHYPKIGQRVHKTAKQSWKETYHKMLNIIEKEKWTPETETETSP
jgi:hypothetical protein